MVCPRGSRHKCWCKVSINKRLDHFSPQLNALVNANRIKRKELIRNADRCFMKLLTEGALNILKENIKVDDAQFRAIRPHKKLMLLMSKPQLSVLRKKEVLLKQKGGNPLIGILGRILVSVATSFFGGAVAKAVSG